MLRAYFENQLSSRRTASRRKARRRRLFECLENRRVLAVGVMTFDAGITTTTSHSESDHCFPREPLR